MQYSPGAGGDDAWAPPLPPDGGAGFGGGALGGASAGFPPQLQLPPIATGAPATSAAPLGGAYPAAYPGALPASAPAAAPAHGGVYGESAGGGGGGGRDGCGAAGGADATAAAVAEQLAANGGAAMLLEALSNMPQVRREARRPDTKLGLGAADVSHVSMSIPCMPAGTLVLAPARVSSLSVWQRKPRARSGATRPEGAPATLRGAGAQDVQQRIGSDLTAFAQPPAGSQPPPTLAVDDDEYDPEQGGAF